MEEAAIAIANSVVAAAMIAEDAVEPVSSENKKDIIIYQKKQMKYLIT